MIKSLPFIVVLLCMTAMSEKKREVFLLPEAIHWDSARADSLIKFASQYLKKPYCYGSRIPKCFDCSGFVMHCFNHFGKTLPHSSQSMAFLGKFVSYGHARKGDLIFFTGRSSASETVGHVGIITSYNDSSISFIHASVQAGVIVSSDQEEYYKKRFMFIKRIKY